MTELKSFSETISFEEPYPGGKGMEPGDRAKNLDSLPETGAVMGSDSAVKEFWDEVERVGKKLNVPSERVVMSLGQRQRGLEVGSPEDELVIAEFDQRLAEIGVSQSLIGSLLKRGWGEEGEEFQTRGMIETKPFKLATMDYDISSRIMRALRDGKATIPNFPEGDIVITKNIYNRARNILRESLGRRIPSTWTPRRMKSLEALVQVKYPVGKMSEKSAKPLAKLAAVEYAKKKGIKVSGKLIKKFIPWIGWGIVVSELVRRAMKKKEFGEFYHKDVGWYS